MRLVVVFLTLSLFLTGCAPKVVRGGAGTGNAAVDQAARAAVTSGGAVGARIERAGQVTALTRIEGTVATRRCRVG